MAEPIIFTLLLGDKDWILEKSTNQKAQGKLTVIPLQPNKESSISDKERIFAEILEESDKQNKSPIFNVQLSNNNTQPIFKAQDLINLQNLNIKGTITFDHYNSLVENPELASYWRELLTKVDHIFFANEQDRTLAVNENIVSKNKTTVIKDMDVDLVLSVFNNLAEDQKVNKLLSDTIPDKAQLDETIRITKNQGGRVIIKTWPLSLDDATNLITAKFDITSEDQIYGLRLEINEILKDQSNAAENLKKYVSQLSQQFQKDLGKPEINPIDFNFDREKIMKNILDNTPKKQTKSHEHLKETQPEQLGFFRRVWSYFKNIVNDLFGTKEETLPPQKPTPTKQTTTPQSSLEQTQQEIAKQTSNENELPQSQISPNNIENIKKPNYLYTEDDIKNILETNIDKNKFSIFHHVSLTEPEILKDTLRSAIKDLVVNNKPPIIPLNTGHEHWLTLTANQDSNGNIIFIYNDPYGNLLEDRPEIKKYITEVYPDAKIKDLKTPQQENAYDCGVFVCDNLIKLAKGQPILSTEQSKNQGLELRNGQAKMLEIKQQAQKIGQQAQNTQSTRFRESVTRQSAKDTSRHL